VRSVALHGANLARLGADHVLPPEYSSYSTWPMPIPTGAATIHH
jgi:hypothetical protein